MGLKKTIIGVVGKIGSGKTTVGKIFSESYSYELLDVDAFGHQALQSEKAQIRDTFGEGIFNSDGEVDRKALGDLVFADSALLSRLNFIVHPVMKKLIFQKINRSKETKFVIDAALLFEMGLDELCNFIVSVEAPEIQIIRRVTEKRHWSEARVHQVLDIQKYMDFLKERSHYIIFNSGDMDKLRKQVEFFILEIS